MPRGPIGAPRLTNIGPLSRPTKEEIREQWQECPVSGKPHEICVATKKAAITILEQQGVYAECDTLAKINGGNCFDIAELVTEQLDYVNVLEAGDGDHVWVEYRGKHYDAERPHGVDNPMLLPTNARLGKRSFKQHLEMAADVRDDIEKPITEEDLIRDVTGEYQ